MTATDEAADRIAARVREHLAAWRRDRKLCTALAFQSVAVSREVFEARVREAIRVDCSPLSNWADQRTRFDYLAAIIAGRINIGS